MWIHEARHEDAVGRIEGRLVRIGVLELSRRADRDDLFVTDDNCAVFDDSKRPKVMSALGAAGEGEELGGGVDEHRE